MSDLHARLTHQSLGRPLTADEERAGATRWRRSSAPASRISRQVARALERDGVKRPSGAAGPWTAAVLEQELVKINASLDAAYAENGIGA